MTSTPPRTWRRRLLHSNHLSQLATVHDAPSVPPAAIDTSHTVCAYSSDCAREGHEGSGARVPERHHRGARLEGSSMRRLLLALVAALVAMVMVASPAGAITGGQKDTQNLYPFVGLLAFYDAEGQYMHRCSGTLISSTVVLTAAHCTDGTTTAYAYFQVEVPDDFRENPTGLLGATYTHPDYNANTLDNDVGVVVLEQAVNLSEYPVLAPEGFLSDLKAAHEIQDDTFVAVGYGLLDGWPPPNLQDNEDRWYSTSPYQGLTQQNLHLLQNPNATGDGGTCFGDSGGPHFWQDTLIIVSVTSWGDAICRANDMTQRIDLASVLDWLAEFGVTPA